MANLNLNDTSIQAVTGLSDLIRELDGDKQQFVDTSKRPELEPDEQDAEIIEETKDKKKPKDESERIEPEVVKDYKRIGRNWFKVIDTPTTFGSGLIADEPARKMAMHKEDKEYLIEQLTEIAAANDWKDPGALPSLIIGAIFGYGEMVREAFIIRKEKKAEERAERAEAKRAKEAKDNTDGTGK